MFFAEDGDVEEGAVAVEFYPCTVAENQFCSFLYLQCLCGSRHTCLT